MRGKENLTRAVGHSLSYREQIRGLNKQNSQDFFSVKISDTDTKDCASPSESSGLVRTGREAICCR